MKSLKTTTETTNLISSQKKALFLVNGTALSLATPFAVQNAGEPYRSDAFQFL